MTYFRLAIAFVALLAISLALGFVYRLGGTEARAQCDKAMRVIAEQQAAELEAERARRIAAEQKADKLRKLPAKVVTLVRENPSGCVLPRPVTDGLREQVRKTNESIALP